MRLALALAILLSTPAAALACRCEHPPLVEVAPKAGAVFVGTVTAVRPAGEGKLQALTIRVERVFHGEVAATAEVVTPAHSCGLVTGGAKVGRAFLFVAERAGQRLLARQCDGSRPATAEALAELRRVLGEGRPPAP